MRIALYHSNNYNDIGDNDIIIDWVRVRKYAPIDPIVKVYQQANAAYIDNPNSENLINYQVRIPIDQPIFAVIDGETGKILPFCFEHSNGECDSNPTDVHAIWVKMNVTAKTTKKLLLVPIGNIEVVDANNNIVPFCYEQLNGECSNSTANWDGYIWVRVPYIPANGNVTLYLYTNMYKDFATSGEGVFDFYDDFSASKTYLIQPIYYKGITAINKELINGALYIQIGSTSGHAALFLPYTLPETSFKVELRAKLAGVTGNEQAGFVFRDSKAATDYIVRFSNYNGGYFNIEKMTSGSDTQCTINTLSITSNQYYKISIIYSNNNINASLYDPSNRQLSSLQCTTTGFDKYGLFVGYDNESAMYFDWVRIEKYNPNIQLGGYNITLGRLDDKSICFNADVVQ